MEKGKNSENSKVARAAGVVGSATMASRVFGFLRDMVVAGFFGAGMATDAFFVAFRIPNLLRRLLAEGSLTVSFVPVFTEYLKKKVARRGLRTGQCRLYRPFHRPGSCLPTWCPPFSADRCHYGARFYESSGPV